MRLQLRGVVLSRVDGLSGDVRLDPRENMGMGSLGENAAAVFQSSRALGSLVMTAADPRTDSHWFLIVNERFTSKFRAKAATGWIRWG